MVRRTKYLAFLITVVTVGVLLLSCGGGSSSPSPAANGLGMVRLSLSDPATCSGPRGTFRHIYVTVTDVLVNQSTSSGNSDAGWVDLTPNLKNAPLQVDLLGAATQCFLATLGSMGIQPGTYEQIRVILADNSTPVSGNKCGSTANCVMLSGDPSTPAPAAIVRI